MTSPLVLLLYPTVGPFAILKLYAKNLMREAYGNNIMLKFGASVVSLAAGSQIAYKYRHRHGVTWFTGGLLTIMLNYWYLIPLVVIHLWPVLHKFIESWLEFIDRFAGKILRSGSAKFRQMLPAMWTLDDNEKLWPLESIRFMLTYGSIGPALYCGLQIYSYLVFGTSFNLCIAIACTVLIIGTLWRLLEAINFHLHPFLFAIIVQYYIIPIQSSLNIPLTLLFTMFLFPFLNRFLTGKYTLRLINGIKALNFRTFMELNNNYKQFYAEFVNLIVTIYLTRRVLMICWNSQVSWFLVIAIVLFLPAYLYTNVFRIISIEPNLIMFILSCILVGEYILDDRSENHFIYKFFLLIMVLTFHFAVIYPLMYHILRRLMMIPPRYSNKIRPQLRLLREKINRICTQINERHLCIVYVDESSKTFILHLCNVIIALVMMTMLPINVFLRLILASLSYLLIGRLLLSRGLEILGVLSGICASLIAGAHVYGRYGHSTLLTMSIALITYMSTVVIAFPIVYRCVQFILICLPFTSFIELFLQKSFAYAWSYFDVVWPRIKANYYEVKTHVEEVTINLINRQRRVFYAKTPDANK